MDNKEDLVTEFQINNFKSYFGDQISLKINKPITIIAGPNGEGKTNLLEAMLVGLANFVNHSYKLRGDSLFTMPIKISSEPEIYASLYDLVFTDLTKKSLAKRPSEISYPERLDPKNIISHKRKKGTVLMRISKHSDRGEVKLAEMTSAITNRFQDERYVNKLDHLELLYLNPDMVLNDFFVKLVGQEFSNQSKSISGLDRKARYQRKILKIFPNDDDRLICDIEDGKFEEKYLKDTNLFLTSNLATGAKKECMLYILGLLAEKHKKKEKWLTMFLIDEIEDGLHISRQKKLIDALIKSFQENDGIRKHIKIVMTTHSPIIYSELMKYPEYVDTYFALRNPKESSKIFKSDAIVGDEIIEKRILAELGLSIYELPRKVVFVEGKTDKAFFDKIFEDVRIIPLHGASIPNILSELIGSIPLARSKEYFAVVDKSGLDKVKKDIKKIKECGVDIKVSDIGFNSLEELIFNVNIEKEKSSDVWSKIEKRVEKFKENLEESEKASIEKINIGAARKNLEKKGKDGLIEFFESVKKKDDFYEVVSNNWSQLLEEKGRDKIKELNDIIEK